MGLSGSKKQSNTTLSSKRIEGNDNPGCMDITTKTNEPVRKTSIEMNNDIEIDNTFKTTEPVQETNFAVTNDAERNKRSKAFEPTQTYAVSVDTEVRNEIKLTTERAVKLKRTCSKYTALEGKVANVGEVYDIDEDLAPETEDSEVELVQSKYYGNHTHLKQPHSVTKRNIHKIDRQRHADFRRDQSTADCYRRNNSGNMPGVTEIPGLCFERDLNESNSDIKQKGRQRERATPTKESKHIAWKPSDSDVLCNGSIASCNNTPYFGIGGINKFHAEANDYVNNYISTSIVMPFNNICIFSADTENLVSDSTKDFYNDTTGSSCESYRVFQVIPENKTSTKPSKTVNRTNGIKATSQKDKTKKTYRLLRYPLKVKVNPYSDVCEVSLPKRMLDDLQVSTV